MRDFLPVAIRAHLIEDRLGSILEVNWIGQVEKVDVLKEWDGWIEKLLVCHTSWLNNQLLHINNIILVS